jgi:proline iminopeptidase
MAPKYWYDPDYDARWLWEGMTINQALIEHLYGTIFEDYHMFGYEKSVPAPTLVVMGKYDYAVPSALWQDLDSIPGLTLKLSEKSGHTPQLEEPGLFLAIILEWLEKNNLSN